MSGVAIVRYLLANDATLTASVPSAKIMAGVIPLNTVLPAISVMQVSGVRRNVVAMTSTSALVTDRVQITVMALTYPSQKSILALVRAALPVSRGTVNGIVVDSIVHEGDGPDFFDAGLTIYMQPLDVMVRFTR